MHLIWQNQDVHCIKCRTHTKCVVFSPGAELGNTALDILLLALSLFTRTDTQVTKMALKLGYYRPSGP